MPHRIELPRQSTCTDLPQDCRGGGDPPTADRTHELLCSVQNRSEQLRSVCSSSMLQNLLTTCMAVLPSVCCLLQRIPRSGAPIRTQCSFLLCSRPAEELLQAQPAGAPRQVRASRCAERTGCGHAGAPASTPLSAMHSSSSGLSGVPNLCESRHVRLHAGVRHPQQPREEEAV